MKKYKLALTITTILFINIYSITSVFAQESYHDVLHLKNGGIVRGTILELIPNDHVKLETLDKNILVYKMEEIEKINKENIGKEKKEIVKSENMFKHQGFFGSLRLGQGLGESIDINIALGIIGGYQVNEYLTFGAGVEYSGGVSSTYLESYNTIPVFFDARFYIPKRRVHPMFYMNVGYSFIESKSPGTSNFTNDFKVEKGGIYRVFGSGIKVFANDKFAFMVDGGLCFQTLQGSNLTSKYDFTTNTSVQTSEKQSQTNTSLRLHIGIVYNITSKKK